MFDLKGKKALVTGSTQGIGFAVAKLLANCGAEIIIHGATSEEKCRKAENGHHRDCQRVRARHCGYGDAESNQRVPDLHAG